MLKKAGKLQFYAIAAIERNKKGEIEISLFIASSKSK